MRVKQIWTVLPLPSKLRLMWDRITFSKLTTIYFIFSLCHCIVQVALQVKAYTINAEAKDFLASIVAQSQVAYPGFPVLGDDGLRVCESVPKKINADSCKLVWSGPPKSPTSSSEIEYDSMILSSAAIPTSSALTPASTPAVVPTSSTGTTLSTSSVSSAVSSSASRFSSSSATRSVAASTSAVTRTANAFGSVTQTIVVLPTLTANLVDDDDDDDDDEKDGDDEDKKDHDNRRSLQRRHTGVKIMAVQDADGKWTVQLDGLGYNNASTRLSSTCVVTLEWPIVRLSNTKREDIVFVMFNVWVLGMSMVALLNESIPHIVASLFTHMLATVWAAFQITHTQDFRGSFNRLVTKGACANSPPLLPYYWQSRGQAELASLILNVVALLASAFLTWRLVKLFGWQTFKRVGASRKINRIYKIVLVFSITIQIALFFMLASLSLWIDQLINGSIGRMAIHIRAYEALTAITIALTIPWLATGWIAARKEMRVAMYVFLGLCIGYLATWSGMFASDTFRWTFSQWIFFGVMNGAGVALLFLSLVFGIISRCNFGYGLSRHLEAAEVLPGDDFVRAFPSDMEKVDYPSNNGPIPTFSVAFGSGNEVPTPNRMFVGARVGPRFYSQSTEPFEAERGSLAFTDSSLAGASSTWTRNSSSVNRDTLVTPPPVVHTRGGSKDSNGSHAPLVRTNSHGSFCSTSSRRWVIE